MHIRRSCVDISANIRRLRDCLDAGTPGQGAADETASQQPVASTAPTPLEFGYYYEGKYYPYLPPALEPTLTEAPTLEETEAPTLEEIEAPTLEETEAPTLEERSPHAGGDRSPHAGGDRSPHAGGDRSPQAGGDRSPCTRHHCDVSRIRYSFSHLFSNGDIVRAKTTSIDVITARLLI